ncbi:MAG: hypothetical protein JWP97_1712 [Labilithrix sp.]|nr:hypothetical protein [Labilithrix sp.]
MNLVSHATAPSAGPSNEYLSFALGEEEYAVEILRVQEIRGMCPLTPLPHAPSRVCGVMNLRGAIVPVIDMRAALGLPPEQHGKFTVIIVLSLGDRTVGFVVDRVSDVLALDGDAVEKAPDFGGHVDSSMIKGIARTQSRFVILLDIDRVAGLGVAALGAP